MDFDRVVSTLTQIGILYRPILDESSEWIIPDAIGRLKETYREYKDRRRDTWGYSITDKRPLRFNVSEMGGYSPQVDIYCDIKWKEEALPYSQEIKIRIWSNHADLKFRPNFDATSIEEALTTPDRSHPGRVISRFHFDKVNHDDSNNISNQYHPLYHIQVGGNAPDYELTWHPPGFDLPRMFFHPMDLFLACQLVAANFFVKEYKEIQKDGAWKAYLIYSQKHFWAEYHRQCLKIIESNNALIDCLCLSPSELNKLLIPSLILQRPQ